ncbi:MAG: thioredoxin-dependent thiol peroxidase [Calditrichaeota bacterium]|nr:MAG: thioredoxin-dependent thiol peroxidase [Calditrichota bacterium]MBL1207055.1 thioredoxin-dependent thiol peroxidase [Calditrichota bacterium]NOG46884.1 thioredoxin-dependent thiol peroxidase [Calditrichota bacterium]
MLEAGTKAPDFNLPDQDGNEQSLSERKGKWIVLYFYPKDMTPGCTTEACNFQETLPDFENLNTEIIGISKDSVVRHRKFADKYSLGFTLVSDEDGKVCEAFGTWQLKKNYGKEYMGIVRSTFIINPEGIIAKVYPNVRVKEHHLRVQEDLKELQA